MAWSRRLRRRRLRRRRLHRWRCGRRHGRGHGSRAARSLTALPRRRSVGASRTRC